MTKALYKGHVEAVLTRTNSINGRVYSEDPTIFGERCGYAQTACSAQICSLLAVMGTGRQ